MAPDDLALALLRCAIGVVMVAHGLNHWRGGGKVAGTASWFEALGLRRGQAQAWASILTEVGAGVLLCVGLLTTLACAAVVSVMLVAGLLAHARNGFFVFKDGYEYVGVLTVAAVGVAMLGPGGVSLDYVVGVDLDGWLGLTLALGVGVLATGALLVATWRPARANGSA